MATLRLEKQQVAALAEYLAGILADLPDAEDEPPRVDLIEPVLAEWVVGSLAVAYEEATDRILLVAEELIEVVVDDEDDDDPGSDPLLDPDDVDTATARFRLTRDQVSSFIRRAAELVAVRTPDLPAVRPPHRSRRARLPPAQLTPVHPRRPVAGS